MRGITLITLLRYLAIGFAVLVGPISALKLWEARAAAGWTGGERAELNETVRRAAPVVAALDRYVVEQGAPPPRLEVLVPRYLPRLPQPGPAARGEWYYQEQAAGPSSGPWVLGITVRRDFCPRCPVSYGDYFVLHPGGSYPRKAYGGILEGVGAWGYYHE